MKKVDGSFTPQLQRIYGKGFEVDRHPVGTYRIDLVDKKAEMLLGSAWLSGTREDYQCLFRDIAPGVFTIETYKIGRKTKLAWPPKGSRVNIEIYFKDFT